MTHQHTTTPTRAPRRPDGNAAYYTYQPDGPHFIEQSVRVYLRLCDDATRWIVDGPAVDGYPLDSALPADRAERHECQCDDPHACEAARRFADTLPLPTAAELLDMLAAALAHH